MSVLCPQISPTISFTFFIFKNAFVVFEIVFWYEEGNCILFNLVFFFTSSNMFFSEGLKQKWTFSSFASKSLRSSSEQIILKTTLILKYLVILLLIFFYFWDTTSFPKNCSIPINMFMKKLQEYKENRIQTLRN